MVKLRKKAVFGIMLTLLLTSTLTLAFNIQPASGSGTIYIRADGSIDPPTAPIQRDGDIYVLANNINESIVVERRNIIIDGNGCTLQGAGAYESKGIYLSGIDNVTIKNTHISGFYYSIYLNRTSYNILSENSIANTACGIRADISNNNIIENNNVSNTQFAGIFLAFCSGNILTNNGMTLNGYCGIRSDYSSSNIIKSNNIQGRVGVHLYSSYDHEIIQNTFINCGIEILGYGQIGYFYHTIENNTVNGKPIYYYKNTQDIAVPPSAGQVIVAGSSNMVIKNTDISFVDMGIQLAFTTESVIENNNIANNHEAGIYLVHSTNNLVMNNNILNFYRFDIYLDYGSDNNSIIYNNVASNMGFGTHLYKASGNILRSNNLYSGGVWLDVFSRWNVIANNSIWGGMGFSSSSSNLIYHNNFVGGHGVSSSGSSNIFDNGYPSGGNYWSDYANVDFYSGPYQNETGSDGVWDHPYIIDANNRDQYPFVNPWGPPSTPQPGIADSFHLPLDESWTVSRRFGKWYDDFQGYHLGEDVIRDFEVPVYAPANGVIKWNENKSGYGYVIVIEHELIDGTFVNSVLGHLKKNGRASVGSTVTKGQVIGYLSSLSEENGGYNFTHLHFGIRKGQYSTEPDRDGGWLYRGYGPANIVDLWYPPSEFINYYNLQKTTTLPKEVGLTVTVNSDKTSYTLSEQIRFEVAVTNPTNITGINITANNVALTISPPSEIQLEAPETYYLIGDVNPGETKTLNFNATAITVSPNVMIQVKAAGEDHTLETSVSGGGKYAFSIIDPQVPKPEWSFAIITDLHIGRYGLESSVADYAIEAVDRILATRFDFNIKFVVVLGDLSDTGQLNEFLRAREILKPLVDNGIPYVPLLGNHDLRKAGIIGTSSDFFRSVFWGDGNLANINLIRLTLEDFDPVNPEDFELQNYFFRYGNINFVCMDLQRRNQYPWGIYHGETRSFLRDILDDHVGERFVFFSHIPWILKNYETNKYTDIDDLGALERDLYDNDVLDTIAFAGHTHRNNVTTQFRQIRYNVIETEAVSQLGFDSDWDVAFHFDSMPTHSQNVTRIVQVKNGVVSDYSVVLTYLKQSDILYPSPYIKHTYGSFPEPTEPVVFTALTTAYHGFDYSYQWDFGDGNFGSGLAVEHVYLQEGDYNVTLTVTLKNLITGDETVEIVASIVRVRDKHVISNIAPNLQAICASTEEDLTQIPENTYELVRIMRNTTESIPVAKLWMDFEEAEADIDFSNIVADVDTSGRRSIIYMSYWPTEVEGDKSLLIPSSGTGFVYICLNATSLDEVKLENADLTISVGETINNITVTTTYYDGREYYLVYGNVTGFGGGEILHNIAITSITFSEHIPAVNETIQIHVTVENRGNFTETFDASLNYTLLFDPLIGTQTITLTSGESITLNFTWTPTDAGRYKIEAYTSTIPNDIDPTDNTRTVYTYVFAFVNGPYYTQFGTEYWIIESPSGRAIRLISSY